MAAENTISSGESLQWFCDLLDGLAARRGCTDLTLLSSGSIWVRVFGKLDVISMPEIRERWAQIIEFAKPPAGRPISPYGYTTTFVVGSRRYRANWARFDRGESMALRALPSVVKTPEDLHIPDGLVQYFVGSKGGLILVGGRTGMGKSTTIASLIERRSQEVGGKYVSLENPIEYRYQDSRNGFFQQREVGVDVPSYAKGLEEAMHQNPDVIIIQEIIDRASGDAALAAALTGHLVVATLHAYTAATLPQRFLAVLGADPEMQSNWSDALASCLQAAVVQELVPGVHGHVPIHEILLCQDKDRKPITSVQRMLRTGNWTGLRQEIEGGHHRYGMITFRESRAKSIAEGLIDMVQI